VPCTQQFLDTLTVPTSGHNPHPEADQPICKLNDGSAPIVGTQGEGQHRHRPRPARLDPTDQHRQRFRAGPVAEDLAPNDPTVAAAVKPTKRPAEACRKVSPPTKSTSIAGATQVRNFNEHAWGSSGQRHQRCQWANRRGWWCRTASSQAWASACLPRSCLNFCMAHRTQPVVQIPAQPDALPSENSLYRLNRAATTDQTRPSSAGTCLRLVLCLRESSRPKSLSSSRCSFCVAPRNASSSVAA